MDPTTGALGPIPVDKLRVVFTSARMQKWIKVESLLSCAVLSSVKKKILERHCSYVKGLARSGGIAIEICLLA